MALKFKEKEAIVAAISDYSQKAVSVVIADYKGLTAAEMDDLRLKGREVHVAIFVVRNTLSRRALTSSPFDSLVESLKGSTLIAFSLKEPGAVARLFRDFSKDNAKLEVKALALSGEALYDAGKIDLIADLPTWEGALSICAGVMKAPVAKLAAGLSDVYARLARVLIALSKK